MHGSSGPSSEIVLPLKEGGQSTLKLNSGLSLPSDSAFDPFFAKLQALKKGLRNRLRISVWGASHVAGEGFTGQLRRRLQAAFGDGGPGFAVLGKPWPSYRHSALAFGREGSFYTERFRRSYRGRSRKPRDTLCGIAGVSVYTRRRGLAWVEPRPPRTVAAYDFFFLKQSGGASIEVLADEQPLLSLFTAAATKSPGFLRIEMPAGRTRLSFRAGKGEARFFGVDAQSGKPGIVLDAMGINGASPSTIAKCGEGLMAAHAKRLSPDMIVMAYGSNSVDSKTLNAGRLEAEFQAFVGRMKKMVPAASCMVIGPGDQARRVAGGSWRVPDRLDWIVEVEKRVALKNGCAFWDWRKTMGGKHSVFLLTRTRPALVRPDHLHLTSKGYRIFGDLLYDSLMTLWKRYLERTGSG